MKVSVSNPHFSFESLLQQNRLRGEKLVACLRLARTEDELRVGQAYLAQFF